MKTKYQKQEEAIERKRAKFPEYIRRWCDAHNPTDAEIQRLGIERIEERKRETHKARERAAREAQVDLHGNPL